MIRLAVNGDEIVWPAVASRLRGAIIVGGFETGGVSLPADAYDAALFVGSRPVEISSIERVLSHGKHVLIVAGTWLTGERLAGISSIARNAGVQVAIVNPDRSLPSRQLIRQQLDAGKLGIPGLVRIHRWEAAGENVSAEQPAIPSPLACDLELATWLVGRWPNSVYATRTSIPDEATRCARTIQVHLGFSDGAMALIDYSNALPSGDGYQSLSVIGSAGAAYADDHHNVQLVYRGNHPQAVRTDEGVRQWVQLTQAFVDGLRSNQDFSTSVTCWRQTLDIVQAVEQSLHSRQAISLEAR